VVPSCNWMAVRQNKARKECPHIYSHQEEAANMAVGMISLPLRLTCIEHHFSLQVSEGTLFGRE
jgi:hypothetical protein